MYICLSPEGQQWLDKWRDTNGSGGVADAVVVEPLHDGTILLEVEPVELVLEVGFVFRSDCFYEVDVLVGVEGGEFFLIGVVAVEFGELEVLSGREATMVSKWLSSWYLRTISSVMATRRGFMGWAKA